MMAQGLAVAGPVGRLETLVEESTAGAAPPGHVAVICHPHPLFGGTLHNKVVHTLAKCLRERGVATVRFNFRGVGASEGQHEGAAGETDDALAIARWASEKWPDVPLLWAGFSFGGAIAIRAAAVLPPCWLVTVAPAVDRVSVEGVKMPRVPWLIVQGEADDVVAPASVIDWAAREAPHARLRLLPDVGHFFHGHLHELASCVREEWPLGVA
jgi:alpha/beta superfamily hydrolase